MSRLLALLAAVCIASPALAQQRDSGSTPGERLPVVKHVLPNGMTIDAG